MKTRSKVAIWLISSVLLCSLTGCLFLMGAAGATELPSANIKILVQPGEQMQSRMAIEKALLSLDYVKQPEDSSSIGIPYKKGVFEISVQQDPNYPEAWLYFYEEGSDVFSLDGIAEYDAIQARLASFGLKQSMENRPDRLGTAVRTVAMFNDKHNQPLNILSGFAGWLYLLTMLAAYGVIVFVPAFWIGLKILNRLDIALIAKRVLFIAGNSLLLTPGLILLTPFGPMLPAPLPIAALFALIAFPLLILLGISFGCTVILASLVSLRIHDDPSSHPAAEALP